LIGVEVVLPTVENAVRGGRWRDAGALRDDEGEASIGGNLQHTSEAPEQGRGAASLEDELVGEDEHARLRQEVGIDVFGLDDRENLAVNQIKHVLPDLHGHLFEPE
jgi:hypothetical protein